MTPADRQSLSVDVKIAEGLKLRAYQDTKGIWTIGYGTNLQELTITVPVASDWLHAKLDEAEGECERVWPWFLTLSGGRQRALVELVYNMGMPRMLGFKKCLAAMARRDFPTASAELLNSKWRTDVGPARSQRIADLILKG